MSYMNDLYQEVILDHNKTPRNRRSIPAPCRQAEGYNPLCGDRVKVYLKVVDEEVVDASFEGSGCAISTASASLMTEAIRGKSRKQVAELFQAFHHLVMGKFEAVASSGVELDKLSVFQGVSEYPVRVKCATLAWHALQAALEEKAEVVSTE